MPQVMREAFALLLAPQLTLDKLILFTMPTVTTQQIALVAAGITASATLTAAAITWVKDRNAAARRIQAIDEATKYVAFWKEVKAQREVTATPDQKVIIAQAFAERLSLAERLVDTQGTRRQRKLFGHLSNEGIRKVALRAGLLLAFGIPLILFTVWFTPQIVKRLPASGFNRSVREFLIAALVGIMAATVRALLQDLGESLRRRSIPKLQDIPPWPNVGEGN